MIKFLLRGLLRDKSRSILPVAVVAIGVTLTVFLHAYIVGFMGDMIEMNARFSTGHLKVMTRGYAENAHQLPNDLALMGLDNIMSDLSVKYPDVAWAPRILFGGLIDAPDANGETKAQGPAMGMGIDLLTPGSLEPGRLNLAASVVRGRLPEIRGEALISEVLSVKLKVNPGDRVTLISSTMFGGMTVYNFTVSGTVSMGQEALDRGTIIADIGDVRSALNMEDAAGEITGFFKSGFYDDYLAREYSEKYNSSRTDTAGLFAPVMKSLSSQGSMGTYVNMSKSWSAYISMVFILAMSLVLWNAGLLAGLRRYGEVGLRLAIGEAKGHVYRSMIAESVMVGIIGSVIGTAFGLFFAWLMQKYGLEIGGMMKGSSIMMPEAARARITPVDFYLGFFPGVISTVTGTLLSGIGIYRRQTAGLFKELEA